MEILDNKSDLEIASTIVAEVAKARNEIACAQGDIQKANSRLGFLLVLANTLIYRKNSQ